MSASLMPPSVCCSHDFWHQLLDELQRRGDGQREAGALLLGNVNTQGSRVLTQAVFYDDIDPNALAHGYVHLDCRRLGKLWQQCRESKLNVVADIHTHPFAALQSCTDKANPMIPRRGHVALIVPDFAASPVLMSSVGVFEYQGSSRWKTLSDIHRPSNSFVVEDS